VATPASALDSAAPVSAVEAANGGQLDAAALRRVWPDVLEATKARKRTAHAMLSQDAQVVDVRGRTVVLSFEHAPIERQFRSHGLADVLTAALREVLGVEWAIETIAAADARPAAAAPATEGFDAGDAPVDGDVAIDVTAPTGEQAAVTLLEEGLGATVIGEVDAS
jgi:DNA polymerase-3 subunit gamma/tau